MTDLYLAMGMTGAATLVIFALGLWGFKRVARPIILLLLLAAVTLLTLYLHHVQDHVLTARYLPVSSAIILGNLTPLLCAAMGALAWWGIEGANWRRIVAAVAIVGSGCAASWHVAWPERPHMRDQRWGPIWRQTSEASCSPAAAATLLEAYGIAATESEMSRLSLTSTRGTRTLGVYRGLNLKTRGTRYQVEPFAGGYEQLLAFASSPVLINVMLRTDDLARHERYVRDWGWIPGTQHTVVLFGIAPSGNFIVGDPATGLEEWSPDALQTLWHGEAFRLTPR